MGGTWPHRPCIDIYKQGWYTTSPKKIFCSKSRGKTAPTQLYGIKGETMPVCAVCQNYPCTCLPEASKFCGVCGFLTCSCPKVEINGEGGYQRTYQCLTCYTTPCVCDSGTSDATNYCTLCHTSPCACTCYGCGHPVYDCQCNTELNTDPKVGYICSKCGAMSCLCNISDDTIYFCFDCGEYHSGVCPSTECKDCERYKEIIRFLLED